MLRAEVATSTSSLEKEAGGRECRDGRRDERGVRVCGSS